MAWNKLQLAKELTEHTNLACDGLEKGEAEILEKVSVVTAELLKWWFQQDYMDARQFNFHAGQRHAILNTIYAHEVLKCSSLYDLYQQIAPDVLLDNSGANTEVASPKNAYPKYCMKMATGTGKTWILQALLMWQVLNANRDGENKMFTRNFLIVTPGLIVYNRLLDAFLGKERGGKRDFTKSDLTIFKELFIPDTYRDEIFSFVQNSVCTKEKIGSKVTGGGFIGITNWHLLMDEEIPEEDDDIDAPGEYLDPSAVVESVIPLTPGTSKGNDLNQLNRRYERGNALTYLRELPSLMVFNDEAHHIHSIKRAGEVSEVEWQKSLTSIAEPKGQQFFQVDFSATPYNQVSGGASPKQNFFAHIIVDFDLKTAMRQALVKSLVLDKRSEVGAISNDALEFKAIRDEDGNPTLADGQRIMLRAGLKKLEKLETDFAKIDPSKHPKMMVMCEDTFVTPLVEDFLKMEGLSEEEILRIDSNRKGEIKQDDWDTMRERLFDIDSHKTPRVVISVLMLREGFDVNNICVIVPLRASKAPILLEQIIGRGLRLMWRDNDYDGTKRENRELIHAGQAPNSMIDVLTIVEHPSFISFYDDLMKDGLVGEIDDSTDTTSGTGDLMSVGLVEGFEKYDFGIPFILQEQEEAIVQRTIDPSDIPSLEGFKLEQLKKIVAKGDKFHSEDVETKTQFGDYRVDGGVMTATGYNDYLSRLVKRISEVIYPKITKSSKEFANNAKFPYMQINKAQLAGWVDTYIKRQIFNQPFEPLEEENWRVLLVSMVTEHIIKVWSKRLMEAEDSEDVQDAVVRHRYLSEVSKLPMRESASLKTNKCIYERLNFPSRSGGFERIFIETCMRDSEVEAFCRINEQKHDFVRLRYLKQDGLPAFYSPDFLVRCDEHIFLVETKAQEQVSHPNVQRKKKAAVAWCNRINHLDAKDRFNCIWTYVLLGEDVFYDWHSKGERLSNILTYAMLREKNEQQSNLFS